MDDTEDNHQWATRYRRDAAEARQRATKAASEDTRQKLLKLAAEYEQLAVERDRRVLEADLLLIDRQILQTEDMITRQSKLVQDLELRGVDWTEADRQLTELLRALIGCTEERDRMLAALGLSSD